MKRTTIAAMLMAAGIGTVAGCSSGATPSTSASTAAIKPVTSPTTKPATTATTKPATTPASVSTSNPATTRTPPAPGRTTGATNPTGSRTTNCLITQLRASIDPRHVPGNGTPDTSGAVKMGVFVDFQNTSRTTCILTGYPGAATVNAAGGQIKQATRTLRGELDGLPAGSNTIPTVSLAPGQYAAAMIEGFDLKQSGAAQAGCADSDPSILVTPPNTRIAVPFNVSWPACFSFDVHPVRALPDAP